MRKLILLELNEVPCRVLDDHCTQHPDSAFARLRASSRTYVSVSPDVAPLHPWSTWPTVHRGVDNRVHEIDHFGQDTVALDERHPPIWSLLVDAGISTGIFGSLNTYPLPPAPQRYAFYIPDTFARGAETHPSSLESYQAFNLSMSRSSARNVSTALDWTSAARFLVRAPWLGLRPKTAVALARQLLDERVRPERRTRRRSFQSVLAWDLFLALMRRRRPGFASFFTNHVASSMHRYWAARYPQDFDDLGYDADWCDRYQGEIEFAMTRADAFVADLLRFVGRRPEYRLLIASSMGQAAKDAQPIRSQLYLRSPERLVERAGLPAASWTRRPAMDPDVVLCLQPERSEAFASFLSKIEIDGCSLKFEMKEAGFFNLVFGQRNLSDEARVTIGGVAVSFSDLGLVNETIDDQAGSTGYHVPEGMLLLFDPTHPVAEPERHRVRTTAIAPFILESFGLWPTDAMKPDPILCWPGQTRLV